MMIAIRWLVRLLPDEHHDSRPKGGCHDADKYGVETFFFRWFVGVHYNDSLCCWFGWLIRKVQGRL